MIHVTDYKLSEVASLFEHSHGTFEAQVENVKTVIAKHHHTNHDAVYVQGLFICQGHKAGSFARMLMVIDDELQIEQENLSLKPKWLYRGLGIAWYRECERRYKDFGIKQINLDAGDLVGGYVWAREGFQLFEANDIYRIWDQGQGLFRKLIDQGKLSSKTCDQWQRQIEDEEITSLQDILLLGHDEPWKVRSRVMWAGKALLLQSHWEGYKRLS